MTQQTRIFIIGHTNIDINITPNEKSVLSGGAAYFAALAASRITQPVGLVTRVGNDFDPSFLKKHVLPEGIQIILDKPTTKSIQTYHSLTDLTDRDIVQESGASADVCTDDIPKEWLSTAEYIHIATMPPLQQQPFIPFLRENSPKALLSIDTDTSFIKNPENISTIEQNFKGVDIVFVNRTEYDLMKNFINTLPNVIAKTDNEGARYLQHGKTVAVSLARIVKAIDVTGAGDMFAGTFLAMRVKGSSIDDALREATEVATESVTQKGIAHLFA